MAVEDFTLAEALVGAAVNVEALLPYADRLARLPERGRLYLRSLIDTADRALAYAETHCGPVLAAAEVPPAPGAEAAATPVPTPHE